MNFGHSSKVSTKVHEENLLTLDQTIQTIQVSLSAFQKSNIKILYLHNDRPLLTSYAQKIVANLEECRKLGLISKIGVSVYEEEDVTRFRDAHPEIKVFQLPENICDRRLYDSKELLQMKVMGIN